MIRIALIITLLVAAVTVGPAFCQPSVQEDVEIDKSQTPDEKEEKFDPTVDPDKHHMLQRSWRGWKGQLESAVLDRFDEILARSLTKRPSLLPKDQKPTFCEVSYTVSNGRLKEVKLTEASEVVFLNNAALMAVQTMGGSPLLKFPAGSRRGAVRVTCAFASNGVRLRDRGKVEFLAAARRDFPPDILGPGIPVRPRIIPVSSSGR